MDRLETAKAFRDRAVALASVGEWVSSGGTDTRLLSWVSGDFRVVYRTPFNKLPGFDHPYGIDVWEPKKVLSVAWRNDRDFEVISFRRGAWEAAFLADGHHG